MPDCTQLPQGVLREWYVVPISWQIEVEFEYRDRTAIFLVLLRNE